MSPPLPPTVAPDWRPRSDAWRARTPSPFAGAPARPLFVGACPRSGTTLLRVLLDSHPDLAVPHETNFVRPLWWGRVGFGDLRDAANRRRAAEAVFNARGTRDARLRDDRLTRAEAVARVAAAPPTLGSVIGACFALYAETQGKPRWGDKRPAYSGFIGPLFELFPDAQYVNVVRDQRGAIASQLGMSWDPPAVRFATATARWEGAIERTDHFAGRLRPDQLLDVRYEDLVADPVPVLERICAFANLRADAVGAMIAAEDRERVRGRVFEEVNEPVTTASVERWRERLTPAQVALVEQATAPLLERFGYRPSAPDAAPDAAEAAELARQRRRNRAEFRTARRQELVRRLRYRRPVADLRASTG